MTTKLISLFALCVLLGTVMLACGGAETTNTANTAPANANTKTAATPASTTATPASTTATPASTTSSGEKIGVAECDDFLAKYEACVSGKVPAASQATYKTSLDTWRSSWKKLAETPQGKAGLATACKSAMEQAKTSLGTYGCTW
jgi:hypothetical protein